MQKGQKNVIKCLLLLFCLTTTACISQSEKEETFFLGKVVNFTTTSNDTIYYLNKKINNSKNILKRYYDFRFENKPFYKIYVGYNEKKDSIIYDSKEKQLEREKFWKTQWNTIDSLFTKNDFDKLLKTKTKEVKWDINHTNSLLKKNINTKLCDIYGNYISRPYYNKNKSHAFVVHSAKSNTTIFVFRKEKSNWIVIDKIENVGW